MDLRNCSSAPLGEPQLSGLLEALQISGNEVAVAIPRVAETVRAAWRVILISDGISRGMRSFIFPVFMRSLIVSAIDRLNACVSLS